MTSDFLTSEDRFSVVHGLYEWPTMGLRFVLGRTLVNLPEGGKGWREVKVLQQRWDFSNGSHEWRDVPFEGDAP